MKINYLSVKPEVPASGYWDMTFIADLLIDLPQGDRELFIIPGEYQADSIDKVNEELNKYPKVMVFITSDEQGLFDCSKLKHPDMIHYCQYGNCENIFPLGYTPHTKEAVYQNKDVEWFFSGQINHSRREQMAKVVGQIPNGFYLATNGFAKGLDPITYMNKMARARCVICPPGNVSQDSFRLYEALEVGAIPIVDGFSPKGDFGYIQKLFPDAPFPIFTLYDELPYLIEKCQDNKFRRKVYEWWIRKKQEIKEKLAIQLGCPVDATTAVIVTSPIKSHPDTSMIEETIKSVRHYFDCKIIIGFDGIRKEQEDYRERYEEYLNRMLWKCNFKYGRVQPIIFNEHKHQSGMMKRILFEMRTPLLLFLEHDTPLVTDEPIDFPYLQKVLLRGTSFLVRFHYEASIPEEHKYLMIGEPENHLQKTIQWSQRPHIARLDFYSEVMKFFGDGSNCFIEDLAYGILVREYEVDGMKAWDRWRTHIYIPGDNIKRSLNLDGRKDDYKFEKEQVW